MRTRTPVSARVRPVEWVLFAFFLYTGILALVLPVSPEVSFATLAVNALALSLQAILAIPSRWRDTHTVRIARDWYSLSLTLLAYKQMGWFAPSTHRYLYEYNWVIWDRLILNDWQLKAWIEASGSLLPGLLELSYLLVYAIGPAGIVLLYLFKRREQVSTFLLVYALGLLLSYAQFPFWPSEPPRAVFPGDLEPDFNIVRLMNLFIVGHAGIHTSVFPSAHVSGAFAAAFAMWLLGGTSRWLRCGLMGYAVLVAVATLYGRYHYAVDAVAGFFVAVAALYIARWLASYERHTSLDIDFSVSAPYSVRGRQVALVASFRNAQRIQTSILSDLEKKTLIWFAHRIPKGVNSDHLTTLGLLAMMGAGLSYWWAQTEPAVGLTLATVFLAINWFGDSLDGTVARVRNKLRPRYGFYVDHIVDMAGSLFLLGGLALSGFMSIPVAAGLLLVYFMLLIDSYLAAYTLGKFQLSFGGFSPTELRILLAIGNAFLLWKPEVILFGECLKLFDVGGVVGAVGMVAVLVYSIVRNAARLYREEPLS